MIFFNLQVVMAFRMPFRDNVVGSHIPAPISGDIEVDCAEM
jgi:hypothetical protein